jgi:NADP-dependent 3-hydroxy acid dehydrogenase YdfG
MLFRDKAIIVTGATSGIGRAAAASFGREAASVVLVGRDEAALTEVSGSFAPPAAARSHVRRT